jgi:hypothetical protein
MSIQQIAQLLNQQKIIGQQGVITFNLANISFPVTSKDVVGGILQEWFENWMIANRILFSKPLSSQNHPDFYLANNKHLEIKTFNYDEDPGFDVANFDAYTRSLLTEPTRLDSEHLIFGYQSLPNKTVVIADFWVKKVWEMAGHSDENYLSIQKKQGVPVNIRPKDWRGRSIVFSCRQDFVLALNDALVHFYPDRYSFNWFEAVETAYMQQTGTLL